MTRKFDSLTQAGKRIAIAKDVIKHIHTLQLASTYCEGDANPHDDEDLGILDANWAQLNCQVCGIGSAAVSALKLSNAPELPCSWIEEGTVCPEQAEIIEVLEPYFEKQQCLDIEAVFEHGHSENVSSELASEWHGTFQSSYDGRRGLLKAIMENIVLNGGTFKPEQVKS